MAKRDKEPFFFGALREILAFLVASLAFTAFYLFLDIGLIMSLIFTLGIFVGTYLLTSKSAIEIQLEKMGLNTEFIIKTFEEAKNKIKVLKTSVNNINSHEAKEMLNQLEKLMQNLQDNPVKVRSVRSVFTTFIDSAIKISQEYEMLLKSKDHAKVKQTLNSANEAFNSLSQAFKDANAKVISQRVLNLDIEAELINKVIKNEGI